MTVDEKVAYILAALETPGVIHKLMVQVITQAIPMIDEPRLDAFIAIIDV